MAYKFRKSDIKKAIEGSGGYVSQIAKTLNCDWHTAKKFINKFDLHDDIEAENEATNDLAEMKLIENIKKNDTTAIIFRLKTRAKDRGYIEQQNVNHSGAIDQDVNLQIEIVHTGRKIATDDNLLPEEAEELKRIGG